MKWCWSRLAGGVVTWEAYELFRIGEQGTLQKPRLDNERLHGFTDSNMARHAFATFIPISVESDARTKIIFDFFDLMAAIAAHGKTNGMSGRKLSRLAGWWAFEHVDAGNGFDGGYKSWARLVLALAKKRDIADFSVLPTPQVICFSPTCVLCHAIRSEE
jgi:hypothetical protein